MFKRVSRKNKNTCAIGSNCTIKGGVNQVIGDTSNGWISVKDRLPTEKDGFVFNRHEINRKEVEVMVYTPKGTGSCVSIDNFIFAENCFLFDKYTDLTVTHWRPLPKPPKELKDE